MALPPPSVRAISAFGPMRATRPSPEPVQREQRALVAGQHEAGRGGRAQLAGNVDRRRGDRNGAVKAADPGGQPQDADHLVVEQGLVDPPGPDRRQQGVAPRAEPLRRARHGQVQRGPGGRLGGPGRRPVRHDQAVVAPLVVQDGAQQRAFRHRRPVDPVVGGHHRPGTRLAHDGLERRQVELAQRPLVDPDVHGHPLGLRVVADEVLDGGTDPLALQAAHVGDPDPRGEQRVLGEALEVPAAVRGPVQVHRGGEQHVHALAPRLGGQQPADRRYPVAVPGGGQRRRRRHVRRGVPLVPGLAADPGRAVGGHDPAQAGVGFGVERPEVRAGQQPDLLLGGEPGYAAPQVRLVMAPHEAGRLTREASAARCASAVPNAIESAFARFRNRCAGCSQVKPMPPCICTHSCAACTATSEQ